MRAHGQLSKVVEDALRTLGHELVGCGLPTTVRGVQTGAGLHQHLRDLEPLVPDRELQRRVTSGSPCIDHRPSPEQLVNDFNDGILLADGRRRVMQRRSALPIRQLDVRTGRQQQHGDSELVCVSLVPSAPPSK